MERKAIQVLVKGTKYPGEKPVFTLADTGWTSDGIAGISGETLLTALNYGLMLKERARVTGEHTDNAGKVDKRNRTTAYALKTEFKDDVIALLQGGDAKRLNTYLDELYAEDHEAIDAMTKVA